MDTLVCPNYHEQTNDNKEEDWLILMLTIPNTNVSKIAFSLQELLTKLVQQTLIQNARRCTICIIDLCSKVQYKNTPPTLLMIQLVRMAVNELTGSLYKIKNLNTCTTNRTYYAWVVW